MLHIEYLKEEIKKDFYNDEKVLKIMNHIEDLEKKHAKLLCTDLQLEAWSQLLLQFLMLFLSKTKSATTKGLEAMFRKTSPTLLVFRAKNKLGLSLSIKKRSLWVKKSIIPKGIKQVLFPRPFLNK